MYTWYVCICSCAYACVWRPGIHTTWVCCPWSFSILFFETGALTGLVLTYWLDWQAGKLRISSNWLSALGLQAHATTFCFMQRCWDANQAFMLPLLRPCNLPNPSGHIYFSLPWYSVHWESNPEPCTGYRSLAHAPFARSCTLSSVCTPSLIWAARSSAKRFSPLLQMYLLQKSLSSASIYYWFLLSGSEKTNRKSPWNAR